MPSARVRYWNSTAIIIRLGRLGRLLRSRSAAAIRLSGAWLPSTDDYISPYAKKGYVAHAQYEFGSILKFVETTFGLPSLGTTDVRAHNITDAFNFSQKPRAFIAIKPLIKNHDRAYFLRRPPSNTPVDSE